MHAHSVSEIQLILYNENCTDDLYHTLVKSEIFPKYYKKFPKLFNLIKAKILLCLMLMSVVYGKMMYAFSLLNLGFTNR